MSIEREVKEFKEIEEGRHTGKITRIEERSATKGSQTFTYIDTFIRLDDNGVEIKYGTPDTISEKTKLGKFLLAMGIPLTTGEKIDIEKALMGKKVSLMLVNEVTSNGTFSKVVEGSIKLLPSSSRISERCDHIYKPQENGLLMCQNCGRVAKL